MMKLNYYVAPVLPEDPDDDVRNEGHDDDEETEEPDLQRGEDDGVDSEIISKSHADFGHFYKMASTLSYLEYGGRKTFISPILKICEPEDIWFRREGGDDVSVEAAAGEEVQDSRVYPEKGKADVEDDVEEDGEDDGSHQREIP